MADVISLVTDAGKLAPYTVKGGSAFTTPTGALKSRIAFSAAHVVCDTLADANPLADAPIDWDATMAYRRYLWSYGLAVAEAMDTAQRGMGLTWPAAKELIRRSIRESKSCNGRIAAGAGTDHLAPSPSVTIDDVIRAYEEQVSYVEGEGGAVILMASRALAKAAKSADDYIKVYGRILSQAKQPVILHWLGEMFDPQLAGYWGSSDVATAMNTSLEVIRAHQKKVDGIKISLLNDAYEVDMRRKLPAGVKMYTGDDFNFDRLILGDEKGYSHALLGIFDAIAPAAASAIAALDKGDQDTFKKYLAPTVPLSRNIFKTPTYAYKTGIVFMAYLNGHQKHFRMIGGAESFRSIPHLCQIFRLADEAGLLLKPDLAIGRMKLVLKLAGID